MNILTRIALTAVLAPILSACSHSSRYGGDGRFTDNGWMNYSNRYVVDLGPMDLSTPGTSTFNLSGLPQAEFTVGIDVTENAQTTVSGSQPSHAVRVRLELRTADGQDIIVEESQLQEWVRSYAQGEPHMARLYRRGEEVDTQLPNGNTRSKRLGLKASEGWGTYFESDRRGEYILKITVLDSELSTSLPARLTLVGWSR